MAVWAKFGGGLRAAHAGAKWAGWAEAGQEKSQFAARFDDVALMCRWCFDTKITDGEVAANKELTTATGGPASDFGELSRAVGRRPRHGVAGTGPGVAPRHAVAWP